MRRLGIDYGRKRVGVALSDAEGNFAYPLVVLANDSKLLPRITEICQSEGVEEIVLGESLNFRRKRNPIMQAILKFKTKLETTLDLPTFLEDESLTSREAGHELGRDAMLDARAAAIILRSFIERRKNHV